MPALAATRVLFLVGDTLSYRTYSRFTHVAPLYSSLCFFNRLSYQSEPLTLKSLGFKSKIETTRGNVKNKTKHAISAIEVPRKREKRVSSTETNPVPRKERVGVEAFAPFRKTETTRENAKNKLKHGISTVEFPKRREKRIIPRETNFVNRKDKVDIGALAPFAAESFMELGLPPLLVESLEKEGFNVPTDVQAAAIPTILKNHDVVIQSYTGSGKTLAYLLPILSEVGPLKKNAETENDTEIEAVVVAPSRELAMQIVREVEKLLGPVHKRLVQQLVGGANKSRQEEALKKNKPFIVVGTPGRIAEMSSTGKLHTHNSRFLVLDEVDELLAFNFREDMHRILEHVGRRSGAGQNVTNGQKAKKRQTVMVSATVPFSVIRAAKSWGTDPFLVQAKSVVPLESGTPANINLSGNSALASEIQTQASIQSLPPSLEHFYSVTRIQHKVDALRRCVHALEAKSVIAFMNHTKQLKDAVYKLEARGMNAAELHGDLSKLSRSTVLKRFRNGEVRVLLTNELSARGLDIPECDLVVNLGLPTDATHYAHRAGRTGRLGRRGRVVTVCEECEVFVVKKIQKQLGVTIQLCEFAEGNLVVNGDEKAEAV